MSYAIDRRRRQHVVRQAQQIVAHELAVLARQLRRRSRKPLLERLLHQRAERRVLDLLLRPVLAASSSRAS